MTSKQEFDVGKDVDTNNEMTEKQYFSQRNSEIDITREEKDLEFLALYQEQGGTAELSRGVPVVPSPGVMIVVHQVAVLASNVGERRSLKRTNQTN